MDYLKKYYITEPGRDESGSGLAGNESDRLKKEKEREEMRVKEEEDKSLKDTIKDKLQEWSNDNERDIAEDNSTPLRSGL